MEYKYADEAKPSSEVLEPQLDTVNTVVLVRSSTAGSPMPLDLDEAERYVYAINISPPTS